MNNIYENSNNSVGLDMRKSFVKKIKQVLEIERAEILARIDNHNKTEIDNGSGEEVDQIQARILKVAADQLAARDREKVLKIDGALKRIQDGSFGVCGACGEDIEEKRLLINPSFAICVGCAELNDIKKRRGY